MSYSSQKLVSKIQLATASGQGDGASELFFRSLFCVLLPTVSMSISAAAESESESERGEEHKKCSHT